MTLSRFILRQPEPLIFGFALVLAGFIGWMDYITGWEVSIFIFYSLPIALVVWRSGRPTGFVLAVFCALVWWWAQTGVHPYRTSWGLALAVISRLFYFSVLAVAVAAVKAQRELDAGRIESLERSRELEREILRTAEQEQQRIGRDLHDSLGPHLAAIGYAATFLADELRRQESPEAQKADQIRSLVGEAVSLTRDLARGIFPIQMDGSGLCMALEDLAKTTSRVTGIDVSFFENGEPDVRDPEFGMHLYRIAQEALTNATRHGGARHVTIVLSRDDHVLGLTIADDGKGMARQGGSRGMGLHSMRYRARAMGGEIDIKSSASEGTIVSCEVPLANLPKAPATA